MSGSVAAKRQPVVSIRQARFPEDGAALQRLLEAYAATLDVAFCRDELVEEIAGLDAASGEAAHYYLAENPTGAAVGCIGLRLIDETRGELIRLFVEPAQRGTGLGRRLVAHVLDEARRMERSEVVLHTLDRWEAACALYRATGFAPIPPYRSVPEAGVLFFGVDPAATG